MIATLAILITAASLDEAALKSDFQKLSSRFKGRIGACVQLAEKPPVCNLGDQRFSIQSVMKMLVGLAALDAVDNKGWKLDTKFRIYKKDLSVFVQPISRKVGPDGYETTIDELIRSANLYSDSAAADILIDRLGGPSVVADFLKRKGLSGVRLDRTERDLQAQIFGLKWRPEFLDPKVFDAAIKALPEDARDKAQKAYQNEIRDTATPAGMANLLIRLAQGKLLSPASTKYFLEVLELAETGQDRLKAGLSNGWRVAHKTGTSSTWKGLTVATNDVGILIAPDGTQVAIVAFIGDSYESESSNAKAIADITRAAILNFKLSKN
ncbi:MAG: class A beta-lactamase [Acidobacteria bacterium]|nr:class A beta-lactamase [Acidobacteriota bacterium]